MQSKRQCIAGILQQQAAGEAEADQLVLAVLLGRQVSTEWSVQGV